MYKIFESTDKSKDVIELRFTKRLPEAVALAAVLIACYDGRVCLIGNNRYRLIGFEGRRSDVVALLRNWAFPNWVTSDSLVAVPADRDLRRAGVTV